MEKQGVIIARPNARNVLEHLSNIAFGQHMAKLEAYEKAFKELPALRGALCHCRTCYVPATVTYTCGGKNCSKSCCGRSFCPSGDVPEHVCKKGGFKRSFCSPACAQCRDASGCKTVVCNLCAVKCAICRERHCEEHVFMVESSKNRGICSTCIDKVETVHKRRKIDLEEKGGV